MTAKWNKMLQYNLVTEESNMNRNLKRTPKNGELCKYYYLLPKMQQCTYLQYAKMVSIKIKNTVKKNMKPSQVHSYSWPYDLLSKKCFQKFPQVWLAKFFLLNVTRVPSIHFLTNIYAYRVFVALFDKIDDIEKGMVSIFIFLRVRVSTEFNRSDWVLVL